MDVLKYGAMGLFASTISELTSYSESQVRTRLSKGGVKLRDYREGKMLAPRVVKEFVEDGRLERDLKQRIRQRMEEIEALRNAEKRNGRLSGNRRVLPRRRLALSR